MNNNLDNHKSLISTIGIILAIFLLAKTVGAFKEVAYIGKSPAFQNTIAVNGKAETNVTPDIATFTVTVNEESDSISAAQTKVTAKANAIIDAMKKGGVDEKDIKTLDYSVYPRYEYPNQTQYQTGKRVLAGYNVSTSIEVKVRKIDEAGKLLGVATSLGATNISGLSLSVEKIDDIIRDTRSKAIADAKVQASKLAKELGVKIVRIVSYNEGGYYPPVYYGKSTVMTAMGGDSAEASPEIATGQTKITSNVSVTYEIR